MTRNDIDNLLTITLKMQDSHPEYVGDMIYPVAMVAWEYIKENGMRSGNVLQCYDKDDGLTEVVDTSTGAGITEVVDEEGEINLCYIYPEKSYTEENSAIRLHTEFVEYIED